MIFFIRKEIDMKQMMQKKMEDDLVEELNSDEYLGDKMRKKQTEIKSKVPI